MASRRLTASPNPSQGGTLDAAVLRRRSLCSAARRNSMSDGKHLDRGYGLVTLVPVSYSDNFTRVSCSLKTTRALVSCVWTSEPEKSSPVPKLGRTLCLTIPALKPKASEGRLSSGGGSVLTNSVLERTNTTQIMQYSLSKRSVGSRTHAYDYSYNCRLL